MAAAKVGADVRVATMLRHPAEVMRSREIAYGTRTANTTRVIGWMTMMLGTEVRTRDLPRATVRYDDLLADWRPTMVQADTTIGMGLFERATDDQVTDAGDAGRPDAPPLQCRLGRARAAGARVLDLAVRTYDTYGLSGRQRGGEAGRRRGQSSTVCARSSPPTTTSASTCARNRTGAFARREKRKVARRVREEMRQTAA